MALYSNLFKYRGRENRSPLEDFLTEALADLLNRFPLRNQLHFVDWLFAGSTGTLNWTDELARHPLDWRTQVFVPGGIADLVLYAGPNPVLVVENKTWSAIRDHSTESEEATQLTTYAKWLESMKSAKLPVAVALLSSSTAAPSGFLERDGYAVDATASVTWAGVTRWLRRQLSENHISDPVSRALAADLITFLKEQNLSTDIIAVSDIAATNLFFPSHEKIGNTFNLAWSAAADVAASFLKPRRWSVIFKPERGLIWEYRYGKADLTPLNSWVAIGLRFPEYAKNTWGIGLPELPHYVMIAGIDNVALPEPASMPTGWHYGDGELFTGRSVYNLPVDPSAHAEALSDWAVQSMQVARTFLVSGAQTA